MGATTGPILATGAITLVNESVFLGKPINWKVPIATGLLAMGFDLFEKAAPKVADVLAWTVLVGVLVTRIQPNTPAPVENAMAWWSNKPAGGKPTITQV